MTSASGQTGRATQPFLKWAGGKRWLVAQGILAPSHIERMVEPFLGSAAVFFSLSPKRALLADVNAELINLYQVIRSSPKELQIILKEYHASHSKEHYYKVRQEVPIDCTMRAARTLYLNRTCWNGLYRVNKKGVFNVPIGTKSSVLFDGEDFTDYARVLESADIRCQDFEVTLDCCGSGDFLFVDPPYTVKHNINGFVKYDENIFSWDDQVRLAYALRRAGKRGAQILVTNADHESIRELYDADFNYRSASRKSVLAGSSVHRVGTTEALFTLNM
ncbi:Dam family site-specific DNA-(adenine-N6)-methyltransferase [Sphingobium yanoikuyae]|uniref:site-specific DNA-methyltransferase (adenine-specific) n=1 Tax=Sphingobium yanoikuyae TaxID=13690 RepID=A0AA42X225_SPHYA|nr:Dam family site-specific DNA-(adenine-N6)-methyltransferase [Sphingobium yanoikuyae]MDH2134512.1 Dam family site-specific DNA-(adenine-N6)-methyltransferase [Sphingobium yanoikuyae]MDH2151997.1 Dam family site-specific DNA-(adenine-N6)-methyltransferase [Sphingobium yanoikuyae]MDH2169944.1 Dam family site-specific DNA-(adenine-N6)-methyltransferase [Sphingobium yanoikuyae]